MPWPVYSERFHFLKVGGVFSVYTVPANRRAVVTTMNMYNGVDTQSFYELDIGTQPVVLVILPAGTRAGSYNMRLVLYAGEQLRAYTNNVGALVTTGYLFSTTVGAADDAPARNTYEPYEEVEGLPAP